MITVHTKKADDTANPDVYEKVVDGPDHAVDPNKGAKKHEEFGIDFPFGFDIFGQCFKGFAVYALEFDHLSDIVLASSFANAVFLHFDDAFRTERASAKFAHSHRIHLPVIEAFHASH